MSQEHSAQEHGDAQQVREGVAEVWRARPKRPMHRQDKAKMTLDDLLERLPLPLSLSVCLRTTLNYYPQLSPLT